MSSKTGIISRLGGRLDGLIVILIGLLYAWGGMGIAESKVGIQDRVGPGFFPLGIALLIIFCGVMLVVRKDGVDHHQVWPAAGFWKPFVYLVGVLFLYGLFFDALGFFVINTLLCVYVGVLLKGKLLPTLVSGVTISLIIFLLFNIVLEISLSFGILSFMEDWLYGY